MVISASDWTPSSIPRRPGAQQAGFFIAGKSRHGVYFSKVDTVSIGKKIPSGMEGWVRIDQSWPSHLDCARRLMADVQVGAHPAGCKGNRLYLRV